MEGLRNCAKTFFTNIHAHYVTLGRNEINLVSILNVYILVLGWKVKPRGTTRTCSAAQWQKTLQH